MYWLKLSKVDPSSVAFGEAFAAAAQGMSTALPDAAVKGGGNSSWPVLVFLGFIFSAPYLIMKLIGSVSQTALEECKIFLRKFKAEILYSFCLCS